MNTAELCTHTGLTAATAVAPATQIQTVYCCDLLSLAVARLPEGAAWVTVMGNKNTVAVAHLAGAACIVLAEGMTMDTPCLALAEEKAIPVFYSGQPVYETAKMVEAVL